jgi:hypothetical protein
VKKVPGMDSGNSYGFPPLRNRREKTRNSEIRLSVKFNCPLARGGPENRAFYSSNLDSASSSINELEGANERDIVTERVRVRLLSPL